MLREGGKVILFVMLAVRSAYSKTAGIGKENLCAVHLSVDLSIDLPIDLPIASSGEYRGNKYRRRMKNKKEGYFLMRNMFRGGGMLIMINSAR